MPGKKVIFYLGLGSLRASSPFGSQYSRECLAKIKGKNKIIRILLIMITTTIIMMMIMIMMIII